MKVKKRDKLEEIFQKYEKMSPEEIKKIRDFNEITSFEKVQEKAEKENVAPIDKEIEEVNKKLENAQLNLENLQDLELKGKKMIEISQIQKQKEMLIKKREQVRKNIEIEVQQNKKEAKLLNNFATNKDAIVKVREYKNKLIEKNERLQEDKEIYTEKLEKLKSDKNIKLENLITIKGNIEEKLKHTEELTNQEYYELPIKKQELEEQIKEEQKAQAEKIIKLTNKVKETEKAIIASRQGISKCDMVWKNLFLGKSWDEISLAAMNVKEKNTRTEIKPKTANNRFCSKVKTIISRYIEENTRLDDLEIEEELEKTKEQEETGLEEYDSFKSRHPKLAGLWSKFKGFFKKGGNKTKDTITDNKTQNDNNARNADKDAFVEKLKVMVEREDHMSEKGKESLNQIHGIPRNPNKEQQTERE